MKQLRFIISIFGLVLMAKGAFAQGFGEVRVFENRLNGAEGNRSVGFGEVHQAEARIETESRVQAKADLMQTIGNLESLRTMPGGPEMADRLSTSNLKSDQITGVFVTFEDGRVYFYDFKSQYKGLVRAEP